MSSRRPVDSDHTPAVPGDLVHKRAASEVLVTAIAGDTDRWVASARLPGHHDFYNDTCGRQSGHHDPLFVLEAFRQGCIAASHLSYRVPPDHRFVVAYYEFAVLDFGALGSSFGATDFEIITEVLSRRRAGGAGPVHGLEVAATAVRGSHAALRLSGSFAWMSGDRWRLLREGASWEAPPQPPAIAPDAVCRRDPAHAVIGADLRRGDDGSTAAPIIVDTADPTFFDHPLDHLPGGLILEASRQLALATMGPRARSAVGPSRLRCDFHSFAELSPGCVVTMTPARDGSVFSGEVRQSGNRRASVELAFSVEDRRA